MKLTRATIPMCPECGADATPMGKGWQCKCGWHGTKSKLHYGYRAHDVAGVVREMKAAAGGWFIKGVTMVEFQKRVEDWADRLEGKQ